MLVELDEPLQLPAPQLELPVDEPLVVVEPPLHDALPLPPLDEWLPPLHDELPVPPLVLLVEPDELCWGELPPQAVSPSSAVAVMTRVVLVRVFMLLLIASARVRG